MRDPTSIGWFRPPPGALKAGSRKQIPAPREQVHPEAGTVLLTGAGFSIPWGLPSTSQLFERVVGMQVGNSDIQQGMIVPLAKMLRRVRAKQGDRFDLEDFTTWIVEEGLADEGGSYNVQWWSKLGFPSEEEPDEDPEFFHRMLLWAYALVLLMGDPWSNTWGGNPLWRPPNCYQSLERRFGPLKGIITLNYDMLPEHMFSQRGIDYGFRRKDLLVARDFHRETLDMTPMHRKQFAKLRELGSTITPQEEAQFSQAFDKQDYHRINADHEFEPGPFPVLKVHGGMNIAHCPGCDKSIVLPPWLRRAGHKQWDYPGYEFGWARCGGHDASFHCVRPTGTDIPPNMEPKRLRPMAIPPIKDKTKLPQWQLVAPVQEKAIQLATSAKRLVIIGTSMRTADNILWDCVRAATGEINFVGDATAFSSLKGSQPQAVHLGPRL